MKKAVALGLISALVMTLGGCVSRKEAAAEPTPLPTLPPTAAPTAEPTPTPSPSPTPTPSPTPEPVVRLVRGDTEESYTIFTGPAPGAAALRTWLLGEGAEIAAGYIPKLCAEPIFNLTTVPVTADIPSAADATRYVRLATDRRILESGLLEAVLPGFESRCGYTVEVFTGDETALAGWADSVSADVVLLSGNAASAVNRRGFDTVTAYFSTVYIIEEN